MSLSSSMFADLKPHDILMIGSLVSDISCTYVRRSDDDEDARPRQGSSNPAEISQCVGGVAHNIALAAHYLGASVLLVSVVAHDSAGDFLLSEIEKEGLSTQGILRLQSSEKHGLVRTGQYVGNYNHDKEFLFGMADVKLMLHPDTQLEATWRTLLIKAHPKIIVLDTTFSSQTIDIITTLALKDNIIVIIEPVSQPRAKDFPHTSSFKSTSSPSSSNRIDMITPNAEELDALFEGVTSSKLVDQDAVEATKEMAKSWLPKIPNVADEFQKELLPRLHKTVLLLRYIPITIVTFGAHGCLLVMRHDVAPDHNSLPSSCVVVALEQFDLQAVIEYFPAIHDLKGSDVVSVNGAGDSLVGVIAVGWLEELDKMNDSSSALLPWSAWQQIVQRGQRAALATLQHKAAVSPAIQDLRKSQG